MSFIADNALIVQSDRSVLLEVYSPKANQAREAIAPFTELIKSPEHIHTYRITPLSIWNARAAGVSIKSVISALQTFAKFPVPQAVIQEIVALGERYGLTVIERSADGNNLILRVADIPLAELLSRDEKIAPLLNLRISETEFQVETGLRGLLKQALLNAGYPAEDLAGYIAGERMAINLRKRSITGAEFIIRNYQQEAANAFYQSGSVQGGSGVVVLPCGAGKTIVGLVIIAAIQESVLVLTSSQTSIHQWQRELIDKTDISADLIAEYSGETKSTGPVTLATYQILTYRPSRNEEFPHLSLFRSRSWGLIIYDEVHLLPAPIFRITAELQARRRLGLTATLIREDGREGDVFALIGPKRYDVPWRDLEELGFIAAADCMEIRIPQDKQQQMDYALAPRRQQFRIAAENPAKMSVVMDLLKSEISQTNSRVLIIGEFITQLEALAEKSELPLVTGKTPQAERERLYQAFRNRELKGLILSRVGNFALDLPDADVLIQVSGKYGSRQEEAQRLGRILRPKQDGRRARFYTLVSQRTCEEDFARHRQLFLTEQGYNYQISIVD